jgi:hypothetical protein
MNKIKIVVNIALLPLSLVAIILITLLEDPWSPVEFYGFGFNLR